MYAALQSPPEVSPARVHALLRSIPNVRDVGVRRGAMRRHLETWSPEALAIVMARLAPLAAARDERARQTAFALGLAMHDVRVDRGVETFEPARALATEYGLDLAADLLAAPSGHKALSPRARLPDVGIAATKSFLLERGTTPRARTLFWPPVEPPVPWAEHYDAETIAAMDAGELAEWASPPVGAPASTDASWRALRSSHRDSDTYSLRDIRRLQSHVGLPLDACVLHPDARFIRRFLDQPWVEARDVLRVATRRPITEPLVRALVESDRWIVLEPVRHAVVTNPFTPPRIVLPLLPSAPKRTLRDVARTGTCDPFVADVAARLLT